MVKNILLVCTGNTCRSSMAEQYLKKALAEQFPGQHFNVSSAGLAAVPRSRASQNAILVAQEDGLDLSEHLATQLTPEQLTGADLVLTMTNSHRQAIIELAPSVRDKVFLLKQYLIHRDGESVDLDILDPFGQSKEAYRQCAEEIKESLRGFIDWLKVQSN
jgi:protein-tyrosine-phosphatase